MRREVVVEAVRAKILLIGNLSQEVGKRLQKRRKKEKTLSNLLICPSGNCDRKSRQMVLVVLPFLNVPLLRLYCFATLLYDPHSINMRAATDLHKHV